jgi:hypothetical protein
MTQKYVDGFVVRNENIKAPKRLTVFDDNGVGLDGAGQVPAAVANTVVATEYSNGVVNRTKLVCTAVPISVADDAGQAQYGGVQLYTFPQGIINLHGAVLSGSLTMGVTGTFIDEFTGVIALGSATASTGTTLVSTEATWLQSTAMSTAAAKVAATAAYPVATQVTESGARWYDGHTTAAPMYLNVAIADDATHTAGTGTWTGTITFLWSCIADY